jgi:hypothetical protein
MNHRALVGQCPEVSVTPSRRGIKTLREANSHSDMTQSTAKYSATLPAQRQDGDNEDDKEPLNVKEQDPSIS